MQPQDFAEAAAYPIAKYRAAKFLLYADSEAAQVQAIRTKEDDKLSARPPPATLVHGSEFGPPQQAASAGKPEPRTVRARGACGLFRGVAQGLFVHPWSSCVRGSRGSCVGGALWAERFASAKRAPSRSAKSVPVPASCSPATQTGLLVRAAWPKSHGDARVGLARRKSNR